MTRATLAITAVAHNSDIPVTTDIEVIPAETVKVPRKRASRAKAPKSAKADIEVIVPIPDMSDFPEHIVQTYADYLFTTRFARINAKATKGAKVVKPRRGDTIYIVDKEGIQVDAGTVTKNVTSTYASTAMDSNGRVRLIGADDLELVAPGMWTKTVQM